MYSNETEPTGRRVIETPHDFAEIEVLLDNKTPWRSRERSRFFPDRPPGVEYGVLMEENGDEMGGVIRCRDYGEVVGHIEKNPDAVKAIWIPEADWGTPWQLLPSVKHINRAGLRANFMRMAQSQGLLGIALIFGGFYYEPMLIFVAVLVLMPVFNVLMAWLTFPKNLSEQDVRRRGVDATLFWRWLGQRKDGMAPLIGFLVVLAVIFLIQITREGMPDRWIDIIFQIGPTARDAGLTKAGVYAGEWWRIFTSGLLHGSIVHIGFNGYALFALGRLLKSISHISLLVIVFVASVVGGSLVSLYFKDIGSGPTVGASGGILGCLGYLCFVSLRFRKTIPIEFTMMMIRNVLLISMLGVIGAHFIDNAAHAGGLVAGIVVGAIIGPHRSDWWNYKPNVVLKLLATLCTGVLAWTVYKTIVEIW